MIRYTIIILVLLTAIAFVTVYSEYLDCRIDHRDGYFLLTDREPIKEACWFNRNPFHF